MLFKKKYMWAAPTNGEKSRRSQIAVRIEKQTQTSILVKKKYFSFDKFDV